MRFNIILLLVLIVFTCVYADWNYDPCTDGPSTWASQFPVCGNGQRQSPIDLAQSDIQVDETLTPLEFNWRNGLGLVHYNGETCQTDIPTKRMYVTGGPLGSEKYYMAQFHTHQVSEHHIDGLAYPLEIHFVHKNDAGAIAVVGFFFKIGETNNSFVDDFVDRCHSTTQETEYLAFDSLISEEMGYLTYPGSLTTPPCTEGVTWINIEKTYSVSRAQLNAFIAVLHDGFSNNRPIQELHGRVIRRYRPPTVDEDKVEFNRLNGRLDTVKRIAIAVIIFVAVTICVVVVFALILLVIVLALAVKKMFFSGKDKEAAYTDKVEPKLTTVNTPQL
jgi:carbonic anhydrase